MAEAGDIKIKVTVEYDGSGLKQAKEDIASLADVGGSLEQSTKGMSDNLGALDEQLRQNASSAGGFSKSLEALDRPLESGKTAMSEMVDTFVAASPAIEEAGKAFEEARKPMETTLASMEKASTPMQAFSQNVGSMGTAWGEAGRNLQVFSEAYNAVDSSGMYDAAGSMQMVYDHLNKTGQSIEQFSSSLGESNSQLFHEMSTDWSQMNAAIDTTGTNFEAAGKSAGTGFSAISAGAADADKAVSEFLGNTSKSVKMMEPVGFGEAFGGAAEGIMGALNDIAMPLMAVQMIGMAVQQVGQSIYDSAAIAEGAGAHSYGTFTGTVDALGQTIQRVGGQFSESFGQQIIPSLNALNYQASNAQGVGGMGGGIGGALSFLWNIAQIGTGFNPVGGMEGIANQWAQATGQPQPYQGPPPEQQAQMQYQQQIAQMPATVVQQTFQNRTQTAMNLADAISPAYLQSQDDLQASQQIYQRLQQSYDISHPVNQAKMIQEAQYQQYAQQQTQNYQAQMASGDSGPVDIPGYWGNFFGSIGQGSSSVFGNLFGGGGGGPRSSALDSLFGGNGMGAGGVGNFFGGIGGGIGGWFQNLFSGGQQDTPPINAPGTGGCFIAGTRVLMADGSTRPIEQLVHGEEVQSHDGTTGRITDCITFPAKQTYKLVFSDGTILFTTDSHPLATTQGWKSIDPVSTHRENPGLPVTPLRIGDLIYTADGSTCHLLSLQKHEIAQVFNITVDTSHTYYANGILVHNAKLAGGGAGVGTEQVSLSHTFTASVTWEAQNLQKSFTAAAQWASQNLTKSVTAAAQWATQNLSKAVTAVANWAEQNVVKAVTAVANWAEQNVMHAVTAAAQWTEQNVMHAVAATAQWVDQNLVHPVVAAAQWAEEGLTHIFTGVASWIGEGLTHTFDAVASWTAQNLTPNFTVNPSFTMLAEGTSNWPGGPAIVGEGGSPEVVEANGQYTMFDQGATLVNLPSGANVYPLQDLMSYSSPAQFADGTGGNLTPISLGSGGNNASQPIIIHLNIDGQTFWSSAGMSLAQSARAGSGMRSY